MLQIFGFKNKAPLLIVLMLISVGCKNKIVYNNLPGYDFSKPETSYLKEDLHEVSGIVFHPDFADSLLAIDDEQGKLYTLAFGNKIYNHTRFGKKGDFEDVAVFAAKEIVVLKSTGELTVFPKSTGGINADSVRIIANILPTGEYEGMYADSLNVYVLCKNCPADKESKEVSLFVLGKKSGADFALENQFKIDISSLKFKKENAKIKFHPSCLARHPITKDWYIISATNGMILVFGEDWKLKNSVHLRPSVFYQPEGMTFNASGDLFISNEGDDQNANILKFKYRPQ